MQAVISRRVACMPACASSWTALKTSQQSSTGMMGLGWLVEMSQMICCHCTSMWRSCREVELAFFRVSWHVFWLDAIRA
jgi:hypothetical protein